VLTLTGLGVTYDGLRALSDVSLDVGAGEFVTLVGPNGAGKTTLLKAI
jgi:ABC-type Fe3+/spermidine/putrescine transport system ATPase subunit